MRMITSHHSAALLLFSVALTSPALASLVLHNYDGDPNLAAAMQYDWGETNDRSKADRGLAEKYYLEYLKKDIPSFQKARVYMRLGALFVESVPKSHNVPDYAKGEVYLQKVLEMEPERIDTVTIRARTLLASLRSHAPEDNWRRDLDVYEWLLSLNDEKYQKLWLPLEPGEKTIPPIMLTGLRNYVPNVTHATAVNAVASAAHRVDREAKLGEIIRRFPNTLIADMAQEQLQAPLDKVADDVAKSLIATDAEPNENAVIQAGSTSKDGTARAESMPPEKSSAQPSVAPPALADISLTEDGARMPWVVYPLVGAALVGGLLFYAARRRKHSDRDLTS
jgi:hypothetical protein